jgi:hypothetical protein
MVTCLFANIFHKTVKLLCTLAHLGSFYRFIRQAEQDETLGLD